jgi:hypothetical protein
MTKNLDESIATDMLIRFKKLKKEMPNKSPDVEMMLGLLDIVYKTIKIKEINHMKESFIPKKIHEFEGYRIVEYYSKKFDSRRFDIFKDDEEITKSDAIDIVRCLKIAINKTNDVDQLDFYNEIIGSIEWRYNV